MSKESYVRGFCKAAEAAGVDPTELAKYAQQEMLLSSHAQRKIARMRALAAKLKRGTSPNIVTNADGSVTSKWKGTFRGGEFVRPTPATQHQSVAPVHKVPSAPTAPTPANKPEVRINNTLF